MFGLFDEDQLIGLTAVFSSDDDPATAVLAMSFIRPDYRGRGLSHLMFEARLAWIAAHPRFTRIVVDHGASNSAVAYMARVRSACDRAPT